VEAINEHQHGLGQIIKTSLNKAQQDMLMLCRCYSLDSYVR